MRALSLHKEIVIPTLSDMSAVAITMDFSRIPKLSGVSIGISNFTRDLLGLGHLSRSHGHPSFGQSDWQHHLKLLVVGGRQVASLRRFSSQLLSDLACLPFLLRLTMY